MKIMKMKFRRLLAFLMGVILAFSLIGCGGSDDNKNSNGGKPVEISYWNSGIGVELLDKMVKNFNKKQSKWYVYYTETASGDGALAKFGLSDIDTVDLYMGGKSFQTSYMEPLDELLESTADGDKKPLKEKFLASYLEQEKSPDGHIYSVTRGGGAISMVYNKRLFKKAGIKEIPRTTDELVLASDKLLQANITPTIHFSGGGYWSFIYPLWQAQYDGLDYFYNNFYSCKDKNGKSPSVDVFTEKDGRYQVVKTMGKLLTPEYVVNGSNSQDFISAQTLFLSSDIGYMVSGTWMSNEMESVGSLEDFGVMKTPVISSITEKLTTVKREAQLRNLISAIDNVLDGKENESKYKIDNNYVIGDMTVSEADWKYVMEARGMVASNYAGEASFIPKYSDAKEGAMEFLKYFYSDEGYKIYTDETHIVLPLSLSQGKIDMSNWNGFEKDINAIYTSAQNNITEYFMTKHDIFTNGGATPYSNVNLTIYFTSTNPDDRKTSDEAWKEITAALANAYPSWLANIGQK